MKKRGILEVPQRSQVARATHANQVALHQRGPAPISDRRDEKEKGAADDRGCPVLAPHVGASVLCPHLRPPQQQRSQFAGRKP